MPPRHPLDHPIVDALWTDLARRLGFEVVRTGDAYASVDGRGRMILGTADSLDADDCVAVLVLHELCHGFVEGEGRWSEPDFGLDNTSDVHEPNELAAQRVQAAFADRFALRPLFFSTTVWRSYYERLPADPFRVRPSDAPVEQAVVALATEGWRRARSPRFARPIDRALAATAAFARRQGTFSARPGEHPLGGALSAAGRCGDCVWAQPLPGRAALRQCARRAREGQPGPRIDPAFPACSDFEPALDCQACGACCREAYHAVAVGRNDPFRESQPAMVVTEGRRFWIRRSGGRCAALDGAGPYACVVYSDRPRTCRDFTAGSENCRIARGRVGLLGPAAPVDYSASGSGSADGCSIAAVPASSAARTVA